MSDETPFADSGEAPSSRAPVYFALNLAEAEYIISYLESNGVTAEREDDEEYEGCAWVTTAPEDVRRALQAIAAEREGRLDEKGVEAIRAAMGFSSGQFATLALWSLLILALLLIAAFALPR